MDQALELLILNFASAYPKLAALLTAVGLLRLVNKSLFTFGKWLSQKTAWKKDDWIIAEVEASAKYRAFCFVLDLVASVKLPQKKR